MLCVFGCPYLTKPKNRLPTSNHHLTTSSQYAVLAHLIVHSSTTNTPTEKQQHAPMLHGQEAKVPLSTVEIEPGRGTVGASLAPAR